MSENQTMEALATELKERIAVASKEAVTAHIGDEAFTVQLKEQLPDLLRAWAEEDQGKEFIRKLGFGSDAVLTGSKYARWGLSVGDVEFLYQVLEGAKAIGKSSGPSEELRTVVRAISQGEFQSLAVSRSRDMDHVSGMFDAAAARSGKFDEAGYQAAIAALDQVYGTARAMDTAETGFGLELIGAQYVSELWRGARAASRVFSLIPTFEMTAPTAYLPTEADLPELLFVSESTANNSSNYDTVKTGSNRVQVDAKKFVMHQMWSGEMEEDSIVPFIPFLREQATRALAHYSDKLVLNGDTTNAATGNINLDDADPADTKHYLAFDGIRHAGLVDNTNNGTDASGAFALTDVALIKATMLDATYFHDWGHPDDSNDLVHVGDPETVEKITELTEVATVDKYGPQATILTGELARLKGHPLISSIDVSKTEADGKVSTTAGNNTKGQLVSFNRRGFAWGWRRRVQVETERLPGSDQSRIVYSMRAGFGRFSPTGAASGIEAAHVLYNITV